MLFRCGRQMRKDPEGRRQALSFDRCAGSDNLSEGSMSRLMGLSDQATKHDLHAGHRSKEQKLVPFG